MNNYRIFILLFANIIILLSCSKSDDEAYVKKELDFLIGVSDDMSVDKTINIDKIKVLAKKVHEETNITIVWDLKYSKSFLELEKYAHQILTNIVVLLEDNELSDDDKFVLAYAIQGVELKYLKYFLRDIATSYRDGKIDEDIVAHCFFPEDDWSINVIQYYKDPIIRESLRICLSNDKMDPLFRDGIRVVLKGKAWRIIKKRRDGEV